MVYYYNPYIDSNRYIHSIDNVVCWYYLSSSIETVLDKLHELEKEFALLDYWELLNRSACSKYDYYLHHIHFGDCFIKLGRYVTSKSDVDKKAGFTILDCMRVEVNPNKHMHTKLLNKLLPFIHSVVADGYIDKFDYAVDIPVKPDNVVVLNTRKMLGLNRGTRYYGASHQHGFVKIYNKTKESKLDYDLTRFETTLKADKPFSSVDIAVTGKAVEDDDTELTPTLKMYLDMLSEIKMLGGDIDKFLNRLNPRTRAKIEPFLHGHMNYYKNRTDIINRLLERVRLDFGLSKTAQENLLDDDEGFLTVSDDDLPF